MYKHRNQKRQLQDSRYIHKLSTNNYKPNSEEQFCVDEKKKINRKDRNCCGREKVHFGRQGKNSSKRTTGLDNCRTVTSSGEAWVQTSTSVPSEASFKRSIERAMCAMKLVDRKNNERSMEMLGLKETLDKMEKANGVRRYGHVVRRDDDDVLKKALMLEVNGQRTRERAKQTWRRQVEENWVRGGGSCESDMTGSDR